MPTPRALAERIAATPFASDTGHRIFVLDTSDDSIDLVPGAYELYLVSSAALGYARLGAATSVPSDKADEVAGQFVLVPGASITVCVAGATVVPLHAKLTSGTGDLHIHRKPL